MVSQRDKSFLAALVLTVLVFAHVPLAEADDLRSASFVNKNTSVNDFGGYSTSSTFTTTQSGGQTVIGASTSTNYVMEMGFQYFDSYSFKSQNWRWYDDEASETPTTDLAAENTAPTNIEDQYVIKLRISVAELANIGSANTKLRLQYSTSSDFSTGANFVAEQGNCLGQEWCYADGGGADNVKITTALLSDADTCVASVGDGCGTHNEYATTTSSHTHVKNAVQEYEFTIVQSGALVNTTYFFRAYDTATNLPVLINTGETYPSVVTGGTTLSFSIDGIDAGISTEGEVTGVTTTPTTIPFGTLPFGAPTAAAQRFTISTNANQGYQIYAYQTQGFLSDYGAPIDPVSGTNASPTSWSSGCAGSAAGCYGYHTGEDVLSGGSTRFSADDTFASFSSTPEEVAFSATPVSNKVTDILYRVKATEMQESGNYSSSLVYIIVPVF